MRFSFVVSVRSTGTTARGIPITEESRAAGNLR